MSCPSFTYEARRFGISLITNQEAVARQSMKSSFLPVAVVDFQHLQQTLVEAVEPRHHLAVAVEPGLVLVAEPAVVRSIGSR